MPASHEEERLLKRRVLTIHPAPFPSDPRQPLYREIPSIAVQLVLFALVRLLGHHLPIFTSTTRLDSDLLLLCFFCGVNAVHLADEESHLRVQTVLGFGVDERRGGAAGDRERELAECGGADDGGRRGGETGAECRVEVCRDQLGTGASTVRFFISFGHFCRHRLASSLIHWTFIWTHRPSASRSHQLGGQRHHVLDAAYLLRIPSVQVSFVYTLSSGLDVLTPPLALDCSIV